MGLEPSCGRGRHCLSAMLRMELENSTHYESTRGQVPGFPGITMFISGWPMTWRSWRCRAASQLAWRRSNRVRVGIGHMGSGPVDDLGASDSGAGTPAPS